jgi:hypothetical protein
MAINRELSQFGRLVQIIDNVSIGIGTTSNVSIGFGTISATTFSGSNILVGTATSTGTASQRLQVTGGAYVSGSVGIGTTNPGSTLDVRATGATIRVQNPAAANYSVLLDPSAVGPRVSFGVNADSSFMEFGAYNLFNNLDTKNRDLKIFSTAVPNAFILRQATGNIGIGTTNPSDKLHVLGNNIRIDSASGSLNFWSGAGFYGGIGVLNAFGGSGTDIVLRADSDRSLIFQTGGANDRGRIDANGTFLVGSATSTGTASQRLQVTGGAYVSGNLGVGRTNPSALFHLTGGSAIGAIIERNSTGESYIRYQNSSGTMHAGISTGATFWGIGDSTNFTNSPYFVVRNTTGSVGIGTNNPTVALQLSPNASISNVGSGITLPGTVGSALTVAQFLHVNTNTSYLRIKATRNATGSDWFSASTKLVNVTDVTEQGYIEYNPNGSLYGMAFGQGGTEWARFLQSGNLGIGTTTPTSRLSVVGDGKFSGVVTATKFVGDGSLLTNLPSGGSSGGGTSSQWTTGATGITTTSNVGIGTTNASYKLHVVGSGTTTLIIDNGSAKIVGNLNVTGTVYATDFDMVPGGGGYQSLPGIVTSIIAGSGITISPTNGTGAVTIYSTNTSQWTSSVSGISTTSNVGINSSIPTSALDVLGNAKISGVTTASSFVKSGGTSSQFLKADGSVDSSTYLTSYTETDTLNSVTSRGNSTSNGISVGVLTATRGNFTGIITSTGANISGIITATSFSGSLANTLTLNTSGTGLSGSTTFNNSGAATFTVTSNATSANTGSAIVARGASGEFTAGAITATGLTLNGGGSTTSAQLTFSGATNNWITFGTNGAAAPAFTTRSVGTKVVYYTNLGASNADYAAGIESSTLWHSVPTTSEQFRWYGGTTVAATLSGAGAFTAVGAVQGTRLISTIATGTAPLTVTSTTQVSNLNASLLEGYGTATANTANAIVRRGASGEFSMGALTAGAISGTTGSFSSNVTAAAGAALDPSYITAFGGGQVTESSTGFSAPGMVFGSSAGQHGAIVYGGNTMYFGTENGTDNTMNTKMTLTSAGNLLMSGGTVSGTQLISTIGTGTAPLTVTSTTQVTNLNAQLHNGLLTATANTGSTVVARDASGNFSAGTITASLTGNVTGNVSGTAANISNTGTVTLATATESNSITITQPSYTTDQPVKLLNFDWYGNTWSLGNIRSGSTPSHGFGVYSSGTERARFTTSGLTVSGTVTSSSDIKLKTNIKTISDALNKVLSLRGVEYDHVDMNNEHQIGVIAQEIESVIPEVVVENSNGIKSVAYGNITAVLIEAIKEQNVIINKLQTEVNLLKTKLGE